MKLKANKTSLKPEGRQIYLGDRNPGPKQSITQTQTQILVETISEHPTDTWDIITHVLKVFYKLQKFLGY